MAKSSGGTGRAKTSGPSRGQQLRDKLGDTNSASNRKINERLQRGERPSAAAINTARSAGERAVAQSGRRSGSEVAATEKAIARRARRQGNGPRGGDATTRANVQGERARATRNANAAAERAIIGRDNVRRARPGRVSPRRAARTGISRNINI